VAGCGRSDLQTGSTRSLYRSLHSQLLTLPSETLIYPAHDARGVTCSSMGEEKRLDPLLRMTCQQLEHAMGHSHDPLPDKARRRAAGAVLCLDGEH
jgi:sulfur dioxygenase